MLYGKNGSSIREVIKRKDKMCASFSVAPQTANVTAIACDKVLMEVEKALNFWMDKHDFYFLIFKLSPCFILFVADHLIQSFIRFVGASYIWHDNVHSGTVGDR
jgi:hypothetical protein